MFIHENISNMTRYRNVERKILSSRFLVMPGGIHKAQYKVIKCAA